MQLCVNVSLHVLFVIFQCIASCIEWFLMQCCDFERSLIGLACNSKPESSFGMQACAEHSRMWDPLVARSSVLVLSFVCGSVMCAQTCAGPCQDACKCWAVNSYVVSVQS